ncbi:MAG: DUF3332 domain-containing protein [Candidatus Cloacimonadales bacterium]|jgi:hypothetical protein|nr:DUF3332 domain-containing protein [Candidatus Cloacimonadales bacterium]
MKRIKKLVVVLLLISILSVTLSGCYGKFALTRKIYQINGSISGDKFIQSIVMWVLFFVPVYQACGFLDYALLNVIEFWTGSNPLAMNETEQEIKYYAEDGRNIKVVTTQNRYDIYDLDNETNNVSFVFNTDNETWMLEKDGKLITIVDGDNLFDVNGSLVNIARM